MKTRMTGLLVFGTLVVAILAGTAAFAGSLDPSGPPGATMKTLSQVEPRTPISSLPYQIQQSGSYYLTTNVTSINNHGVIIQASFVTLDLMGFTISGTRDPTRVGVWVYPSADAPFENIVVRNGSIRGFDNGVYVTGANSVSIEELRVAGNRGVGIWLRGESGRCSGNRVVRCNVSSNGIDGIRLSTTTGRCDENTVRDCVIRGNEGDGVYIAPGQNGQCNGNKVVDCAIGGNGSEGVMLQTVAASSCIGNALQDCTISGNESAGVSFYAADGHCNGNVLEDCLVSDNGSRGVSLSVLTGTGECDGNRATRCVVRGNLEVGIYLFDAGENRIEENHVSGQTGTTSYGIWTAGSSFNNLIFRNTCVGQTYNFNIDPDDTFGPIVTNTGALPTTGAGAHPWANFSR